MSHTGNPDKAKRYLSQLDEARCSGQWTEVGEIARKVGKHAPWRKCLVLTAQAEAENALATTQRPSTASSLPNRSSRPSLLAAINNEKTYPEDVYQAKVCLVAGYLSTGERESAVSLIPDELPAPRDNAIDTKQEVQGWTHICTIKAAFLADLCRGSSKMADVDQLEVLEHLSTIPAHIKKTSEYHFWAEKLLMRLCGAQSRKPKEERAQNRNVEETLAPFRSWAKFWEEQPGQGLGPNANPELNDKRRQIWWNYYQIISTLLREGYVYPTSQQTSGDTTSPQLNSRMAQSTEIRRVEATYEGLLMKDLSFPKANEIHTEIDEWVDQLMANWCITCGSSWQDDDLGEGGQEAASRGVLDMLYRAATRSFHSNSILRHLFTVHASLAEFELSSHALDSYMDLITRGKLRAEKSGEPDPGLDSDVSMLKTIASGVGMLCRYGHRKEAVRAEELATFLQDWLSKHLGDESDGTGAENTTSPDSHVEVASPDAISAAHKAIAISKANWARFTWESSQRADLQSAAIYNIRQSIIVDPQNEDDPSTLYPLAVILAETRDLDGAIATIKHALSTQEKTARQSARSNADLADRQGRVFAKIGLVQCWHLLGLLLSAREDFEKAEAVCEAAVDIFEEHERLPGEQELKNLSILERQHIIEAKMTQMALSEINNGPGVAVNEGAELLQLYSKIFQPSQKVNLPATKPQDPPKTSSGHRSLRESIFGKAKDHKSGSRDSPTAPSALSNRLSTDTSRPPTIAINDGDFITPSTSSSNRVSRKLSNKLQKRPSQKSLRRSRVASPARTVSVKKTAPGKVDGADGAEETPQTPQRDRRGSSASQPYEIGLALSDDGVESGNTLTSLPQIQVEPIKLETATPKAEKKVEIHRPVFPIIPPKFAPTVQERYSMTILSQIWVFVSGLYRRANMLDDARGAIDEAFDLASKIEVIAAAKHASAAEFQREGYGGFKSCDRVFADAYAETAFVHLDQDEPHQAMHKFEIALSYFPNHPAATIGLSNILLDIYAKKIPPKAKAKEVEDDYIQPPRKKDDSSIPPLTKVYPIGQPSGSQQNQSDEEFPVLEDDDTKVDTKEKKESRASQESLERLSARDRAYGLLSTLTKLGSSWDDSEAWFALARACEESGQIKKAKELLWWVVELEGKKPVRSWQFLGQGYSV